MLAISGVSKSFDGFMAVKGLSLNVAAGERHAMIGPNGAGKTTIFNLITGHLVPDCGEIRFKDRPITGLRPHRITRLGIARSFQRINIYPRLSVLENVRVAHIAHHGRQFDLVSASDRLFRSECDETLEAVGLIEDRNRLAGTLAYGKQKQLELAIALAADPALLLLDEPTAGMSPHETEASIILLDQLIAAKRLTLLFTEHDMKVVFSIADRITILHQGKVIASGAPDAVRVNPEVQRVYLGGGKHADA